PARRIMRELDPQEREGDIALGAATENIVLASLKEGFRAQVDYLPPDGKPGTHGNAVSVSIGFHILEERSLSPDRDLHNWIETRGMNRSLYAARQIPQEQLVELKAIARQEGLELHVITQRDRIHRLAALAGEAGRFKFS